jgi:hypothetical protein
MRIRVPTPGGGREDGSLYRRPAEIEALIDEAEGADLDALRHRAGISRSSADGFLPLECLVYFIRDAGRRGDEQATSALMPHLLNRCEAILKAGIPTGYFQDADTLREEILGGFAELFTEDGIAGTQLAQHTRKVDALRTAQLDLLNHGLPPYFWASFQIVGDSDGTL